MSKDKARRAAPRRARDPNELDYRERMFVESYVGEANFNGSMAAKSAGYSAVRSRATASVLLKLPRVIAAVADRLDERSKAMRVSQAMVLGEAFRSYLEAKADGKFGAAARFLEMAGRHVDVNAFRTIIGVGSPTGGPIEVDVDLSGLTDEELEAYGRIALKISGGGAKATGDAPEPDGV